jgi:hypothetical protein
MQHFTFTLRSILRIALTAAIFAALALSLLFAWGVAAGLILVTGAWLAVQRLFRGRTPPPAGPVVIEGECHVEQLR